MNWRTRIKTWEAVWLLITGFLLLVLLARVAYSYAEQFKRSTELREQIANAFEQPACERVTQLPVTELPEVSDVDKLCIWVVFERRYAHKMNRPTHITAANVRASPLFWSTPGRSSDLWDLFMLGLGLLPALYGLGLATEFVMQRGRTASSARPGEPL